MCEFLEICYSWCSLSGIESDKDSRAGEVRLRSYRYKCVTMCRYAWVVCTWAFRMRKMRKVCPVSRRYVRIGRIQVKCKGGNCLNENLKFNSINASKALQQHIHGIHNILNVIISQRPPATKPQCNFVEIFMIMAFVCSENTITIHTRCSFERERYREEKRMCDFVRCSQFYFKLQWAFSVEVSKKSLWDRTSKMSQTGEKV